VGDVISRKRPFYVYIIFDWRGAPRYVGKGKGTRWLHHEQLLDLNNRFKTGVIKRTIAVLGEVPKIKIRENLTEKEAFELEIILIKTIGRYPNGPLTNLTNGGDGVSGTVTFSRWINNGIVNKRLKPKLDLPIGWEFGRFGFVSPLNNLTSEQKSEAGRKGASNKSYESKRDAMLRARSFISDLAKNARNASRASVKAIAAKYSPEERSARQRLAGLAAVTKSTPEQRRMRMIKAWETRRKKSKVLIGP
jgi:hypothetical protein